MSSLIQLLAETRGLKRLGVSLPAPALNFLTQENRIKSFQQQLQQVTDDLYESLKNIDKRLDPLFDRAVEIVFRYSIL